MSGPKATQQQQPSYQNGYNSQRSQQPTKGYQQNPNIQKVQLHQQQQTNGATAPPQQQQFIDSAANFQNAIIGSFQKKAQEAQEAVRLEKLRLEEEARKANQQQQQQSLGGSQTGLQSSNISGNGNNGGGAANIGPHGHHVVVRGSSLVKHTNNTSFPEVIDFQMRGRSKEVASKDPLKHKGGDELIWIEEEYRSESRTSDPNSCWRSAFTKHFVDQFAKKGAKTILQELTLKGYTNKTPWDMGIFLENAPVTRSPQNALYDDRVQEILKAYAKTHVPVESGGDISNFGKHVGSSLSFVGRMGPFSEGLVPDDLGIVFDREDLQQGHNEAQMKNALWWSGTVHSEWTSCILNPDVRNPTNPEESGVYILYESKLHKFMEFYWDYICRRLGQQNRHLFPSEGAIYTTKSVIYEGTDKYSTLSPVELASFETVLIMDKAHTDAALGIISDTLKRLPFEDIKNWRIYVTPLNGPDGWTSRGPEAQFVGWTDNNIADVDLKLGVMFKTIQTEPTSRT